MSNNKATSKERGTLDLLCRTAIKEIKKIFKDEAMLIFFILVPLLYPLLYSWIYTNEVVREVPVAVVDMSRSNMSRDFTRKFDASPDTRVAFFCNSIDEAKVLIGKQEAFGILYFPTDFQVNTNRMEQSHVSIYSDMSFMLYYKNILQTATAVAGMMNEKIQINLAGNMTQREDEISVKPLDFDEVQIFNTTGGYGNFIIPGVLMLIIQQTLLLGAGITAGTSRERGLGMGPAAQGNRTSCMLMSLTGRATAFFLIYAIISAYLTLVVPRIFNFTSILHGKELLCFMLPYLLACIFFSITLSSLMKHREDVMLIVVFSSVPLLFISGVSWPQSAIPEFWQWVSALFPSTFGIRGFVRMNTMGAVLEDIKPEYMALWLQTAFYFITSLIAFMLSSKKTEQEISADKGQETHAGLTGNSKKD